MAHRPYPSSKVAERFHPDRWSTLSVDERKKTIQELENSISHEEGRRTRQVVYDVDPNKDSWGYYQPTDPKHIHLNPRLVEDNKQNYQAMSTTLHEGRHGYQQDVLERKASVSPDFVDEAKKWKVCDKCYNQKGKVVNGRTLTDIDYRNQANERDANDFADFKMKENKEVLGPDSEKFLNDREAVRRYQMNEWELMNYDKVAQSPEVTTVHDRYERMCNDIDKQQLDSYNKMGYKLPEEKEFIVQDRDQPSITNTQSNDQENSVHR